MQMMSMVMEIRGDISQIFTESLGFYYNELCIVVVAESVGDMFIQKNGSLIIMEWNGTYRSRLLVIHLDLEIDGLEF